MMEAWKFIYIFLVLKSYSVFLLLLLVLTIKQSRKYIFSKDSFHKEVLIDLNILNVPLSWMQM